MVCYIFCIGCREVFAGTLGESHDTAFRRFRFPLPIVCRRVSMPRLPNSRVSHPLHAIEATPDGFSDALKKFHSIGARVRNVTLPHKRRIRTMRKTSERHSKRGGEYADSHRYRWDGDNTDVPIDHDLTERHRHRFAGLRCLLVGAGGAARV